MVQINNVFEKIEKLEDLIKDSVGGELIEQNVSSLVDSGENFGSIIKKVDFKVKKDGNIQEYNAVAKCTPLNTVTQELFQTQVSFPSEIAWYTTVIPTLKQFKKEHGSEEEIDFFQRCFGARISLDPKSKKVDLHGVLLTQNLKTLGYVTRDRHVGFNLPEAKSVLKALASLHGVALALRRKNPEIFNKSVKPYLPGFKETEQLINSIRKQLQQTFDKIPSVQYLQKRISKVLERSSPFFDVPLVEPWITVVHNDAWVNNIMVTDDEDPKVILLDLQIPTLGSPTSDVLFFLLTSVKIDVVKEKFDELLKYYYENFIYEISNFNVSKELFSYEEFLKEMDRNARDCQFLHSLSHTNFMMDDKGKTDFDSSNENYNFDDLLNAETPVTERHVAKFSWIALEAAKRNWI